MNIMQKKDKKTLATKLNTEWSCGLKKIVTIGISLMALNTQAHADRLLGVYADASLWMYDTNATISNSLADEEINFGFTNGVNVSVALEHFVPFVPNVRLRHGMIDTQADKEITLFRVANKDFTGKIDSSIKIAHTDVLAYYQILDNVVSADIGLGAKIVDADIAIKNKFLSLEDSGSPILPMLYASVGGSLPFTGLSARADLAGIKFQENQVIDAQAEIKYNVIDLPLFDLGGKVGYRYLGIKTDELLNSKIDVSFKGPYAGIEAHF